MLRILNPSGLTLQLEPGTTIPVERNNPLFNDADKILQDIVYSAQAPMTPGNIAFHQGGHRVEARNGVYEFPVEVYDAGVYFFRGTYSYKINSGKYDFQIRVNLGEVAAKIKATYLTDIITDDADYSLDGTAFETMMMSTLQNPAQHRFAFFPVWNDQLGQKIANPSSVFNYYNTFDYAAQKPIGKASAPNRQSAVTAPFFKVSYILKQVLAFMGVKGRGDWFESTDANQLYIYTRRTIFVPTSSLPINNAAIYPSMLYMPYITVADFLKFLRQRLHISLAFDMIQGTCRVHSLATIQAASPFDISPWCESVKEISLDQAKGYSITLKPDEQDELFNTGTGDESKYLPLWRLDVGAGETKEEMEAGTLVQREEAGRLLVGTQQLALSGQMQSGSFDDFPAEVDFNEGSRNQWPLRLIRYTGMKQIEPGKYWPESLTFDVSEQDAAWYSFLNDSKNVIIRANIPPLVLSRLSVDEKICFRTKEGAYVEAVCKKIAYDQGGSQDRIAVEIQARTLKYEVRTTYTLTKTGTPEGEAPEGMLFQIKACYDPQMDGIPSGLTVNCSFTANLYPNDPDTDPTPPQNVDALPTFLAEPCDAFGTGGSCEWISVGVDIWNADNFVIKVWSGKPQYLSYMGKKTNFTLNPAGYYQAPVPTWTNVVLDTRMLPMVIVY